MKIRQIKEIHPDFLVTSKIVEKYLEGPLDKELAVIFRIENAKD